MTTSVLIAIALLGVFIAIGCWLGWQLLRQNGRILLRLDELEKRLNELEFWKTDEPEGLPIGSEAPAFELPDLTGEHKSLSQFLGQPVLLLFFNPECGFCRDLAPKLVAVYGVRRQAERGAALDLEGGSGGLVKSAVIAGALQGAGGASSDEFPRLIILTTGDAEKNRRFFIENKVAGPILLQKEMEVASAYQANGTPTGYLIDANGKIASGLAVGADALLALAEGKRESRKQKAEMERNASVADISELDSRAGRFSNRSVARSKIKRDGLKAGTPAPEFRLPRLDGRGELALSDLRGKRLLLAFSDPNCGPCQALAPELEEFHRAHSGTQVVMISRGEPKENRAKVQEHRLTFPIILQQQWEISRLYAMFATPIAYLVDENGIIARDVAIGVDPILSLMKFSQGDEAFLMPAAAAS